ncbi:4-(cytidine 5'-diphospho)-2-C-methyl-D-erythritol kinase [Candidatus Roizmanbacteria bacterium CG_4_9_14_0_2_um_filter_36_12]|uniref:4-diphosphocytidyl-2-C-methyl-D-erythritol kinase n=1 Tax=Candidatus Roizmanbacteria bacterium CG_4_9_14_0_2_um_filter_36_12 TaxID=1974837 RepID=A0A2M8EYQ9_9BACT|nr:MAG: 4-(cytidine 5'-diphospho)-2-C-methyl-D-erythritol kinase [Candidatus Roizmanbacteria bacterium CG_4_9_14_0_2_um_filter_36_12]
MIKEKAWAKLNLNLHLIPKKLKNDLYPVRFINCQINLFDELSFKSINKNVEIVCDNNNFKKEENLVYRTAILLKKLIKDQNLGAKIYFKKNIPIKAGLAGGGADAAATITGLSKLWQIKLDQNQLDYLAHELGKDVYYCLRGGLCQIEGDESKVISLASKLSKLWLVIITPEEKKPSTAWMYNNLDINNIGKNQSKLEKIKQAIKFGNKKEILENLHNDFEPLAVKCCPKITSIKSDLINNDALDTLLAGSGFSIVGFFDSKNEAVNAFNNLKVKYKNIFYASTK